MFRMMLTLAALSLASGLTPLSVADAQVGKILNTARREVERKATKVTREAVRCALGDTKCAEDAAKADKPVVITDKNGDVITDENGTPVSDPADAATRASAPGEGVWRNYDFVPGRHVLKVISFDSSAVGRFPANLLTFVRGAGEIVEFEGVRMLESKTSTVFRVDVGEELGQDFTLEFYLRIPTPNIGAQVHFRPITARPANDEDYLNVQAWTGIYRGGRDISATHLPGLVKKNTAFKLQVLRDGSAIFYAGTTRASLAPVTNFPRTRFIEFRLSGSARFPVYVSDIVVATGLDDAGEILAAGKTFTTRGIHFDFDSHTIRGESTKALAEIRDALTAQPGVRVAIHGHTDSDGDADYNQQLSERRAGAIVDYLAANGIDRARLEAVGKGESTPVASNDTPEGRAENRRVDVVVIK
jgi:outer membrane protein OmpA-like peptidoglycan-associated protein